MLAHRKRALFFHFRIQKRVPLLLVRAFLELECRRATVSFSPHRASSIQYPVCGVCERRRKDRSDVHARCADFTVTDVRMMAPCLSERAPAQKRNRQADVQSRTHTTGYIKLQQDAQDAHVNKQTEKHTHTHTLTSSDLQYAAGDDRSGLMNWHKEGDSYPRVFGLFCVCVKPKRAGSSPLLSFSQMCATLSLSLALSAFACCASVLHTDVSECEHARRVNA